MPYSVPYDGYKNNDFYEINRKWRRRIYAKEDLDWYIKERNQGWHETYFARRAVKDHQAKGNCRFAMLCLDYMESQGWLQENDLVLDPMCGIGSFLIVAALKGYDCIGVELERSYYNDMIGYDEIINSDSLFGGLPAHTEGSLEAFKKATDWKANVGSIDVVNHDARDLTGAFSKFHEQVASRYSNLDVICSPPYTSGTEASHAQVATVKDYTGQKAHVYSDDSIAVLDSGAKYNREMRKVYKSLYGVLGSGSHVCLITRNFIQKGKVVFLDELTMRLMQSAGFKYLETKRASLPDISFFKRNNWQKHFAKTNLPMIDWEEATFYIKEIQSSE